VFVGELHFEIEHYCNTIAAQDGAMSIKLNPNHSFYIRALRCMSSEARLMKAFELTEFSKQLFLHGLRKRFPDLTEEELHKLYLERLAKCHNRNY
jgi:hypothetical protein